MIEQHWFGKFDHINCLANRLTRTTLRDLTHSPLYYNVTLGFGAKYIYAAFLSWLCNDFMHLKYVYQNLL